MTGTTEYAKPTAANVSHKRYTHMYMGKGGQSWGILGLRKQFMSNQSELITHLYKAEDNK